MLGKATGMDVFIRRATFFADSADEALDLVDQKYARVLTRHTAGSGPGRLRVEAAEAGVLGLDRLAVAGLPGSAQVEPPVQLCIGTYLDGQVRHRMPHAGEISAARGDTVLCPQHESVAAEWTDTDLLLLRLPWSEVGRSAAALFGLDGGMPLQFTGAAPVSARGAEVYAALAAMAYHELRATDSVLANPLVNREVVDTILTAIVTTFPNTTMTRGYVPGPGSVHPAAVRRAVAFIDANISLPINLTDIAHSAGTSPRAIRAAFHQHLETTPIAYLRRTRLEAAHRELASADPETSDAVRDIALRWGFSRADRFATAYRRAYGTTPEHTRRA